MTGWRSPTLTARAQFHLSIVRPTAELAEELVLLKHWMLLSFAGHKISCRRQTETIEEVVMSRIKFCFKSGTRTPQSRRARTNTFLLFYSHVWFNQKLIKKTKHTGLLKIRSSIFHVQCSADNRFLMIFEYGYTKCTFVTIAWSNVDLFMAYISPILFSLHLISLKACRSGGLIWSRDGWINANDFKHPQKETRCVMDSAEKCPNPRHWSLL